MIIDLDYLNFQDLIITILQTLSSYGAHQNLQTNLYEFVSRARWQGMYARWSVPRPWMKRQGIALAGSQPHFLIALKQQLLQRSMALIKITEIWTTAQFLKQIIMCVSKLIYLYFGDQKLYKNVFPKFLNGQHFCACVKLLLHILAFLEI